MGIPLNPHTISVSFVDSAEPPVLTNVDDLSTIYWRIFDDLGREMENIEELKADATNPSTGVYTYLWDSPPLGIEFFRAYARGTVEGQPVTSSVYEAVTEVSA